MNKSEEAGDLLWRYLDELKRVGDVSAVNFVAKTSLNPVEAGSLLPLADELYNLHEEGAAQPAEGFDVARAQLLNAIRADMRPAPRKRKLPKPSRKVLVFTLLMLLLIGAAFMSLAHTYKQYFGNMKCPPPAPMAPGMHPRSHAHPFVQAIPVLHR
jgi:hypothetical protein